MSLAAKALAARFNRARRIGRGCPEQSTHLADVSTSIPSGKRPGMQSRDSQGRLQTIREQPARGGRNSRTLVTNITPYRKPGNRTAWKSWWKRWVQDSKS